MSQHMGCSEGSLRQTGRSASLPFAAAMGVQGRFVDPQELMNFCFQIPIRNLPHLEVNTPKITGNFVEVLGEKFSKRDWTLNRPTVCPGCIAESRHHRAWFDLMLLRFCPIHNEILVGEVNGEQFATWFPGIGVAGKLRARALGCRPWVSSPMAGRPRAFRDRGGGQPFVFCGREMPQRKHSRPPW